eukprot:scaffold10687_cov121-Isochrysis_galbana.AAC.4
MRGEVPPALAGVVHHSRAGVVPSPESDAHLLPERPRLPLSKCAAMHDCQRKAGAADGLAAANWDDEADENLQLSRHVLAGGAEQPVMWKRPARGSEPTAR